MAENMDPAQAWQAFQQGYDAQGDTCDACKHTAGPDAAHPGAERLQALVHDLQALVQELQYELEVE
ncbi:hypothetical protein FRC10_007870 [Ceratobasidium sp. 414]|nr:hypothetical protein FRC10_007870 [Ceratobasidium sp. 414]